MSIVYRPARLQDLEHVDGLIVRSINELTERHGFGPMARPGPSPFQAFSLRDDSDGLWVAEDGDRLVGFAFSWVSGDLWFLAQLFIAPDLQGQGIGNELMQRTLEQARKAGVTKRGLITFTFNRVSQALYIRRGLFPRFPIYGFSAAHDTLRLRGERFHWELLEATPAHLRSLADIDASAMGVSREKHHRYLLRDGVTKGLLLYAGSDCVGYAYVDGGYIGPLAVVKREAAGRAFTTALSIAIESGMRITFPMLLMADRDFGDWTCYLARNPGFM